MIGLKPSQMDRLPEGIIRIIHTDSVEELAQWYSTADVYVNLTYGDTFPTTNIEALACGTPVISYDAGGSGEIVTEDTGAVVEKADLEAVMEAVDRIKARDMSENCVKRASGFAKRDKYKEYHELYKTI